MMLLLSLMPAVVAEELPQYLLDAQAAVDDAKALIEEAEAEGVDTTYAWAIMCKLEGLLNMVIEDYLAGDTQGSEDLAIVVIEIAEKIDEYLYTDNEDGDYFEIDTMVHPPGRAYRWLQLQKHVDFRAQAGQVIIDAIDNEGGDTSELEPVVESLNDLLDEIKMTDPTEPSFNKDYVDFKKQANDLVREFRAYAVVELALFDTTQLKEDIANLRDNVFEDYRQQIQDARELFSEFRAKRLIEKIGMQDDEVYNMLDNGEITAKEAMQMLRAKYAELSPKEKQQVRAGVKELREEQQQERQQERQAARGGNK
jgi:hypothetical protein